jgi:hypothetical protein
MKRLICRMLCVGLLAAPLLAASEGRVGDGSGEVTLGWQKFNELWDRMHNLEHQVETLQHPTETPAPPYPFALTKAAYRGDVGAKQVVLTGLFELEVFEPKQWVKVPFLPMTLAVMEASLDGHAISLVEENGFHTLAIHGAGRHSLRVKFALKAPPAEDAPRFSFPVPRTPMTVVSLDFSQPHLDVDFEPSQGVESVTQAGHTRVTAAIPPTSQISVHWQKALVEEVTGPSKVYLDTAGLLTISEGSVRALWTLHYNILHRGIRELRLRVPTDWNILSVTGEGIQEWKVQTEGKTPMLIAQLGFIKKGDLDLAITAEKGLSEKDTMLTVPHLEPVDVEREQGALAVEIRGPIDVQVQDAQGLNLIDPKELPPVLWQAASQPILFAFRYTRPHSLSLAMQRHPEAPVLTTVIDDANAVTVYSSRGPAMTKIRYQVRNHLKQYLTIALPATAELWSAFVSDQPVKPMRLDDGRFRIPLAKSALETQGDQGFPVEITYYLPKGRFFPLARKTAVFPIPDAPVSRLLWSVYIPERYRPVYFGGDLEKGDTASGFSPLLGGKVMRVSGLRDEKSLNRLRGDVTQLASVAYDEMKSPTPVSESTNARSGIAYKQIELLDSLNKEKDASHVAGVLPVAFEIPTTGQLFHFAQTMVVDEQPALSFIYVHESLVHLVQFLLVGILIAVGYWRRRELRTAYIWLREEYQRRKSTWVPR